MMESLNSKNERTLCFFFLFVRSYLFFFLSPCFFCHSPPRSMKMVPPFCFPLRFLLSSCNCHHWPKGTWVSIAIMSLMQLSSLHVYLTKAHWVQFINGRILAFLRNEEGQSRGTYNLSQIPKGSGFSAIASSDFSPCGIREVDLVLNCWFMGSSLIPSYEPPMELCNHVLAWWDLVVERSLHSTRAT